MRICGDVFNIMGRYCFDADVPIRCVQTFVSTLGYYSTRVIRPVLNEGIDAGDTVVVLRPAGDDDRGTQAVQDVRQTLTELGPGVEVVVEEISYDDFERAVLECVDVLQAASGTVVVNFGGGPREVFLPFTIATLTNLAYVDHALQFRDVDETVQAVQLPDVTSSVSAAAFETLRVISELGGETDVPAVTEASEKSRSTIARHMDTLEEAGCIETTKHGKTRVVALTLGGELRLA